MNESTPFEVKYQNKTGILTVSQNSIECKIGNNTVFSIDTKSLRTIDIPKREYLLMNWQQDKLLESIAVFSKHVIKIKESIILAHEKAIS